MRRVRTFVIAIVAYVLFLAARRLWLAGVHVLAAFARFLGVLVYTLPTILLAGCIALAGPEGCAAFVATCRQLRFWAREAVVQHVERPRV